MKLFWRRSSLAEDRFEAWIKRRHQERVLSGQTESVGPCPDEAFLENLARKSRKIALSDPRVDHAATCPICMSRILAFREEYRSHNRKLTFAIVAAACLVLVAGLIAWSQYESHRQKTLAVASPISKTVDLWNSGTYRGQQTGQLQSVTLPAARVQLTIILPRFSTSGRYLVAVTRDQSGNGVVVEGAVSAVTSGEQEMVSVDLDLRRIKSGAYFLSMTHEQDHAAYYYPLQIK